ncbi:tetratricopeptide repeat protein [Thermogutta sp.]|uniref:tetratricopeptide repeat protein n=1 Tax=Thermogutta sp. TaxID=1962930 RepID=UPI003C7D74F8
MNRVGLQLVRSIALCLVIALFAGCRSTSFSADSARSGTLSEAPLFNHAPPAKPTTGPSAGQAGVKTGASSSQEFDLLAGVKDGLEKVGELLTFTEPVQQAPDPTSLSTKAKPSPRLFVAMARLAEDSGQTENAEQYYQKALQLDPKYLDALLGLGRMKDRQGELEDALSYYSKAVKAYPDSAPAWNHLGLCYARLGRSRDAINAFEKAVNLAPREPRYRHNLATVLVQIGDLSGAMRHLSAVHDEATACYNLGYLLAKKGDNVAALRYFNRALTLRPNFPDALAWRDALTNRLNATSLTTANTDKLSPDVSKNTQRSATGQNRELTRETTAGPIPPPTSTSSQSLVAPLPPVDEDLGLVSSPEARSASGVKPFPPVR